MAYGQFPRYLQAIFPIVLIQGTIKSWFARIICSSHNLKHLHIKMHGWGRWRTRCDHVTFRVTYLYCKISLIYQVFLEMFACLVEHSQTRLLAIQILTVLGFFFYMPFPFWPSFSATSFLAKLHTLSLLFALDSHCKPGWKQPATPMPYLECWDSLKFPLPD